MKKIIFIGGILVLLLTVYSCKEGLESEIFGELNPTTFPSTEAEYELYTMEVYVPFSVKWPYSDGGTKYHFFGLEEGHVQLFDAPTDLMAIFTDWGDGGALWEAKSRGNFAPFVGQGRNRAHFEKVRFITRTTTIIGDLEVAPDDLFISVDKGQLIGEARLARGWAMLFLLQMYGPVPVILDPEKVGDAEAEANLVRPSRDEYVSAIEADLQFAADNLPVSPEQYGRFNRGLALTVLMRLHMNEKNFADAETAGRAIQNMGVYDLVDDYASLFREATDQNSETIWAVTNDPSSQGRGSNGNFNAYQYYTRPSDFPGKGGWGRVFVAPWGFYDSFDPADERRSLLVDSYITVNGDGDTTVHDRNTSLSRGAIFDKYPPEGDGAYQAGDVVIARYADVLLMLAEAINENNNGPTTEAIDLVNEVRNRAGIGPLPAADIASMEAFNDAILRERGWELYFEGLRLHDLVRHGEWPDALTAVPGKQPGPPTFPIPQYAVNDGVAQNPEYGN